MRTYRLQYKFLIAFVAFFVILLVPFSIVVYKDYWVTMERLDSIEPLSPEQRAAADLHFDEILDNFMFVSFYVFVLAFIFSLFFAKIIMDPVKQLYRGARELSEGNFNTKLDVTTSDELGEVTRAFNQMADALRKQNEELNRKDHYLAAMVDPMWVVDEDNFITDINPAFSRLLGYGKDEVVGSSIFDFIEEEDGKVMRRKFFEADPAEPPAYEISVISKTEGIIPVLLSVSSIMEDGEATGRIGIIKDFRREAALREAIKEEKEDTEAIMDSMVDHLVVVDRDYRILRANLAARVDMGERLLGEFCGDVLHGGSGRCAPGSEDCPARKVFETGQSRRTVHEHVQDGHRRAFVEIVAFPGKDIRGDVKHAVLSMRDITEQKQFEDEIERKNRELTMFSGISKILGRSLNAEDIFNRVLDKLTELVGMDGGGIYLLDEMHKSLMCAFHRGVSEGFVLSAGHIKLGEDIPGRVALTGNAFVSSDVSQDGRAEKSVLKHSGVKAYACFPIMGKEKLAGVFFMFGFKGRVFTPEEERTFGSISEMMGISLENVRLYEKMRELYEQNRNRRAEEHRNLLDLSTMLATTLDLKKVLASSISLIRKACRADFVWLLGLREDHLVLRAASDGDFAGGEEVYLGGAASIERRVIEKKKPFVTRRLAPGGEFRFDTRLEKYGAACSVPLYIGDRALGAFTLYYLAARELPEEEVHFLQTVGSVLAVALERTRLYENVIIQKGMAETVLESITDGVVTVDGEGAVMAMNSAAGRITGLPPEDAVGNVLADILGASPANAELRLKVQACIEDAIGGKVTSAESNFTVSGGRRLPLVFRSAPVRDGKGETVGVVFVLRDLSVERELDAMKSDFVRSVSHEFRTPLTAIVGMTEMVLEGEVGEQRARDYLSTVLAEANRLSEMVSDVLDLAKIEGGKEIFTEGEIDFRAILKDVGEVFEYAIKKKNAGYKANVNGTVKGFRGDADRLKQMLRNLVENSLAYSDRGCNVRVSVRGRKGGVTIEVSDDGWGIPGDELQYMGEKFYRGGSAAGTKGSGLGLSLSKEIAKMHGGSLTVESEAGKGTRVVVELPERRD